MMELLERHVDFDVSGKIIISRSSGSLGFHVGELSLASEVAGERTLYSVNVIN
jgi:hypothetical protein